VDGAARFGDQHVHLGGSATGAMTRTVVPILATSADLARVDLVGRATSSPTSSTRPRRSSSSPSPTTARRRRRARST